jgi:hypothetical protein
MADTLTIAVAAFALDPDPGSGQRLVDAIEDAFHSGKNVCLDFSGIDIIPRSFITNSLRVTAALHTPQFLKHALTVINVSPKLCPSLQDIFQS